MRGVDWPVTIPREEQRKPEELAAELAAEAPGVLAWAVRGCLDWAERGLDEPDTVRAATAEYRAREDTVGRFLDAAGYLVRSADHRLEVAASALTSALDDWCDETGERPAAVISPKNSNAAAPNESRAPGGDASGTASETRG